MKQTKPDQPAPARDRDGRPVSPSVRDRVVQPVKKALVAIGSIFIDYPGKPVWRQWVDTLLSALILAFLIKSFIVQAFYIPSGSMENTLFEDDHILVSKIQYYYRDPLPREIVVFWHAEDEKYFIKRVIGLPGDRIEVKDKQLYVNGERQNEPYVVHKDSRMQGMPRDQFGPVTVPPESFFMMGDNRDYSRDSRFWGFVARKDVVGKAFVLYFPFNRLGPIENLDEPTPAEASDGGIRKQESGNR